MTRGREGEGEEQRRSAPRYWGGIRLREEEERERGRKAGSGSSKGGGDSGLIVMEMLKGSKAPLESKELEGRQQPESLAMRGVPIGVAERIDSCTETTDVAMKKSFAASTKVTSASRTNSAPGGSAETTRRYLLWREGWALGRQAG
jgi:hypothetical protein